MRGPLMALTTSAEILAEDVDHMELGEVRQVASAMRSRALWLQGLVENVLGASAVRAGRFAIQPQQVSLLEIVQDVHTLIAPVLTMRSQPLRVHCQAEATDVLADPRRIGQVVVNFVMNASKFSPRGAPIEVVVKEQGGWLCAAVVDRGPGLPPGDPAVLFEPYRRGPLSSAAGEGATGAAGEGGAGGAGGAGGSDEAPPEGVGLGLAIARAIVTMHGGRIGARQRLGGGALFWFAVPSLYAARTPPPQDVEGIDHIGTGAGGSESGGSENVIAPRAGSETLSAAQVTPPLQSR